MNIDDKIIAVVAQKDSTSARRANASGFVGMKLPYSLRLRTMVASIKCMAGISFLLTMGGCADYTPAENYCEAEHRQIPDIEIKGRMLAALRNDWVRLRDRPGSSKYALPPEMEQYLNENGLRTGSPDEKVRLALSAYVKMNPLCCQLSIKEIFLENNFKFREDDDPAPKVGYFANLYLIKRPFFQIPEMGMSGGQLSSHQWNLIYSVHRAYNCGGAVFIQSG